MQKIRKNIGMYRTVVSENGRDFYLFGPGMFLVLIGLVAIVAPRLLLGLVAGFLLFLGIMGCFLAYKFVQLKRKVESFAQNFDGKIVMRGIQIDPMGEAEYAEFTEIEETADLDELDPDKKIVYH